ncbi:MAG TPA: hypothetical protein VKN37_07355 [Roseovarius sp.]|nr:hypothetical protein [Roseovarius sp.]
MALNEKITLSPQDKLDGLALLVMRLGLAWFIFLWAAHKVITPKDLCVMSWFSAAVRICPPLWARGLFSGQSGFGGFGLCDRLGLSG